MLRRIFILLLFIPVFSFRGYTQNNNNDRLREIVNQYKQATITIPYPGFKAASLLSQKVSVETVRNKRLYIVLSPLTVDWFIRQHYNYTIEVVAETKGVVMASGVRQAMEWNSYPTYNQYDSILRSLSTDYPTLCKLDTIGRSINGRLILALKISDNAGTDEEEPEVFYTSTIHGNETGGFVLMLRLAHYLLNEYGQNSRVRNLVDNLGIWINPLANPDGTYSGDNTIVNPVRFNANGEDLNRNFPDPEAPYIVPQKETTDMISFMRKHRFVLSSNFHSGNEVVNYPWDRWSRLHADDTWFNLVSRKYADTVHLNSPAGYMSFLDNGVTNGYKWYSIYGGRQDYVTYSLQGREVTIELDDNYVTPATQLAQLWDNNRNSLLGYLGNALSGVKGIVRDEITNEPVAARIFIHGHDRDSSQVYSTRLSGSYLRLLAPGRWNLTFSAPGYYDTPVNGVDVEDGIPAVLDVKMIRFAGGVDTTNTETPFLYPNPAISEIKAVLPHAIHGSLNIKIINSGGSVVSDYDIETQQYTPVIISLKRLRAGGYTVVFQNKTTFVTSRARFIVIKN